jgi:hypothetical protein
LAFDGIARYRAARPPFWDDRTHSQRLGCYVVQRKVRTLGNGASRKDSVKLRFGEKVREQMRKANRA